MKEELKELGLTKNEIEIYLALLELSTSTPSKLSDKLGLSRSYIYDALNRLQEKEFVNTILIKNKKNYQALNPTLLLNNYQNKLDNLKNIIPSLTNLQKSSKETIRVELHKGKHIYKILLNDIISTLKKGQEVLIFGIDDKFLLENDQYYKTHIDQYYKKIKNLNIKEKCIVKKDAQVIKEWKNTTYKFLSKEVIGNTAFEVYANKVVIFLWGNPHHLIMITSKEVAESYKNQFKIMWDASQSFS